MIKSQEKKTINQQPMTTEEPEQPQEPDFDCDDGDDSFQPCDECDLPDACADFGCAIKAGLKRPKF